MLLTVEGAATRLEGPLLFLRRTLDVGLADAVEVRGSDGRARLGRIAAIDEQFMTVEVLENTAGLTLEGTVVRFLGQPLDFGLGPGILGRVFNGVGQVIDGGPPVATHRRVPIEGLPMNPVARALPRDFIETGITTLDLMNSLVRGQKLPLFSGGGLPHDRLAVEIASHARLLRESGDFVIVFAGIGVPYDSAEYFRRSLEEGGALERTALFLNLASDSSTQRLLTPRYALSAAEYLAFVEGKHVLVILTDMTNYCEALREVSSSKGEIPARKGFPGYMYSDLATLFERAGCLRGLAQYGPLRREFIVAHEAATAALRAAIARHGLAGLQVMPAADLSRTTVAARAWSLMGVRLQETSLQPAPGTVAAAVEVSPEGEACRDAFADLLKRAATLAGLAGNLERLSAEYRRAVRRARALQDVMLPELDRNLYDIENRLEEGEQEDAIWMRRRPATRDPA